MSTKPEGTDIKDEPKVTLAKNIWYVSGRGSKDVPAYVTSALEPSGPANTGEIADPAELLVFSSSDCPHCPLMVRASAQLALANSKVQTYIVDVQGNAEWANRFKVQSVPTTFLDRRLSWTGVLSRKEVMARILSRGEVEFDESVFRSMVEGGRLDDATKTLHTPEGRVSFSRVWNTSTTATRIGMMMIVETVLEANPAALDDMAGLILAGTESDDAALRGDTADLLGQIGHKVAEPALRSLLNDPNPDVAEIATDALEAVDERKHP